MGGSTNGNFGRTLGRKNQYREKINSLPKNPKDLEKQGWKDITPKDMSKNTSSKMYTDTDASLKIRFDKGKKGAPGFAGKDHYHIINPKATSKGDYYLDKYGNPVPKNSKNSHIIP